MSVDDPLAGLPPPLNGVPLRQALAERLTERPTLIEGLLYDKSVLLLAADAGAGKSTLLTQLAAQASLGQPVFGQFACPDPLRFYYLMSERDEWEPIDRLRRMEASVPFNVDRLIIDAKCVGLNLTRASHRVAILNRIKHAWPDVVAIDPIYGFFEGGLSGEDSALLLGRFTTAILKCVDHPIAVIWGHHNVKNSKQPDGMGGWQEKSNPFYGSQFLKAHCTGYYDITQEKSGTHWRRKKDTYGLLQPDFRLAFDVETNLSHAEATKDGRPPDKRDAFRLFLQSKHKVSQPFTAQEAMTSIGMTYRYFLLLSKDPDFAPMLRAVKPAGQVTSYLVQLP